MTCVPLAAAGGACAQGLRLPQPEADPMAIDLGLDPVLAIGRTAASASTFRALIVEAVRRHPAIAEALASGEEAAAAQGEAYARGLPSIDASLSAYETIARNFSNDPQNIIERSRARRRVDLLVNAQQPLFDFGATRDRYDAASARLRAAARTVDQSSDDIALRAIAAWYDVFSYRAMAAMADAFVASQRRLGAAIDQRVASGVAAPGDVARVEGYVASAERRLATFRRQQAGAEARFEELVGRAPPAMLGRAPAMDGPAMTRDAAQFAAAETPQVQAADAIAQAARQDARAARADTLPNLSAGIDGGRYGVVENNRDYDIRARITLRQRLFGGIDARADQQSARARAAEARAATVRIDAARDAAIAWSDVEALEQQRAALERSYVAGRRSRDVLTERFLAARGSLFDLLAAEDGYFDNAAAYIQAVTELDAARYVLLSRTGRLLPALGIAPSMIAERR